MTKALLCCIFHYVFLRENHEILHKAVLTHQVYENYLFLRRKKIEEMPKKSKNLFGVSAQVKIVF